MNKKESNVQQENVKELLNLIQENPNLRIVPLVASEIVADDNHCWWCGSWGKAKLDEYWVSDDRIYLKDNDFEDLVQEFIDVNYEDYPNLSDEELDKIAEEKVNSYEWKKAIIVYIETP
jgi:hypothetical protein